MIRQLTSKEVHLASTLADSVYSKDLWEPEEAFFAKQSIFPEGALGAFESDQLIGYAFGHPWTWAELVPISSVLKELPPKPDCYYLHDIAIHPDHRRKGLAFSLALESIKVGRSKGFDKFLAVAVNGTLPIWSKIGFCPIARVEYAPNTEGIKIGLIF